MRSGLGSFHPVRLGTVWGCNTQASADESEQIRYVRLGSVPKPGEAGRFLRATNCAGDEIVVRYSEPGCVTRTSLVSSPDAKVVDARGESSSGDEKMTVDQPELQPSRESAKSAERDPVEVGKSSGQSTLLT